MKKRQGFLEKYYPEGDGDFFKNPKGLSLQAFECFITLLRVLDKSATRPTILVKMKGFQNNFRGKGLFVYKTRSIRPPADHAWLKICRQKRLNPDTIGRRSSS